MCVHTSTRCVDCCQDECLSHRTTWMLDLNGFKRGRALERVPADWYLSEMEEKDNEMSERQTEAEGDEIMEGRK